MILALDIGNTNVVLGCIADGEILFTERMATDSGKTELDYAISLKMVLELREIKVSEITGAIIGSVVPPVTSLMREAMRIFCMCFCLRLCMDSSRRSSQRFWRRLATVSARCITRAVWKC